MKRFSLLLLTFGVIASGPVLASSSQHPLADVDIELNQESYQRGAKVVMEVCNLCHEWRPCLLLNRMLFPIL